MEQATIQLAKRAGIEIDTKYTEKDAKTSRLLQVMNEAYNFYRFYLYSSEEGKIALTYLKNRGIDDEIIKQFKIGLAPKAADYLHQALTKKEITTLDQIELGLAKDVNGQVHDIFRGRIMFSVTNAMGQIVGFSGRVYEKSDQAKYINSIENPLFHKGEILYHFDQASLEARKLNQIYIFEGFMDVIAVQKAGILNSVATMGTAMTKEHVQMMMRITKNIVLFFDGDEAGITAMKRSAHMLSQVNVIPNAVVLPENMDPDEYISKFGPVKFNEYIQNNIKNVYIILYELAYQKVYLQDFMSVENFKKEIFEMIRIAHSEIVTNYFLKRLAEDLNLDVENIRKEVQTISSYPSYSDEYIPVDVEIMDQPKEKVKEKNRR